MERSAPTAAEIDAALRTDMTIDIVTTGARSGRPRETEIWFMNIEGRILICGTVLERDGRPVRRDWLANLTVNPTFTFRLKESVHADLDAVATEITDPDDRRSILSAPETAWYRDQGQSLDHLVAHAPIVEVTFPGR